MSNATAPSAPEPQADLVLVNLISRGYTMAEAKKMIAESTNSDQKPSASKSAEAPVVGDDLL